MKRAFKAVIALVSILLVLGIIVSIPMVPTGMLVPQCSRPTSCTAVESYESISQQLCLFTECGDVGVLTATSAYTVMASGTASSSSQRGSGNLMVGILNPGSQTSLASIYVSSSSPSSRFGLNESNSMIIYQCPSVSSCNPLSSPILPSESVTNFNTAGTSFYVGSNISSGTTYYYVINLANGQSLSGQLTAS